MAADAISRHVRVFISSSFADMKKEREGLASDVFPQLRSLCASKGISLADIDLRWGIDADTEKPKVIAHCLAEVYRCQPYIICLIGQRYGWQPTQNELREAAEVLGAMSVVREDTAWVASQHGRSVTHLEIEAGVLRVPVERRRVLVYVRDPAYTARLAPELQGDYVDKDEDAKQKLHEVIETLRQSKNVLLKTYASPDELPGLIRSDFLALLQKDFPPQSYTDPWAAEQASHEAFALSRMQNFVNLSHLDALSQRLAGTDMPGGTVILSGESGTGKSSLLANLYCQLQASDAALVAIHFAGHTTHSAHYMSVLQRLLWQFQKWSGDTGEEDRTPPKNAHELSAKCSGALFKAANVHPTKTIYIILDALNQLLDVENAHALAWLPENLPSNARLITSCIPGSKPYTAVLTRHPCTELPLRGLDSEHRRQLIEHYLKQYGKHLMIETLEPLIEARHVASPLHVKLLLDELRVVGRHDKLAGQVEQLLAARQLTHLFEMILRRLETNYDNLALPKTWSSGTTPFQARLPQGLVARFMIYILLSRNGLSENELLGVLGVTRSQITPLLHAVAEVTLVHTGLMTFSHDAFAQSIKARYLRTDGQRLEAHRQLQAYFTTVDDIVRKTEELPYHMVQVDDQTSLKRFLSQWSVFEYMFSSDLTKQEMAAYWRQTRIEEARGLFQCQIQIKLMAPLTRGMDGMRVRRGTTVDSSSLQARLAARKGGYAAQPPPAPLSETPTRQQLGVAMAIYRVARAMHEWGRYEDAGVFYQWALCMVLRGAMSLEDAQSVSLGHLLRTPLSFEPIVWEAHPSEHDNMSALGPLGPPTARRLSDDELSSISGSNRDLLAATPDSLRGASIEGHATTSQAFVACAILEAFARLRSHEAKSEQARQMLEKGIEILDSDPTASRIDSSRLLAEMGWLLIVGKQVRGPKGAIAVLMRAILAKTETLRERYKLATPDVTPDAANLSQDWVALLEAAAAAAAVPGAAESVIDKSLPAAVNRLGVAYTDKKNQRFETAEFVFNISLRLHRGIFGSLHPATATVLGDYGGLFLREFERRQAAAAPRRDSSSTGEGDISHPASSPDSSGDASSGSEALSSSWGWGVVGRNFTEPLLEAAPAPGLGEETMQRSQSLLGGANDTIYDLAKSRLEEALKIRQETLGKEHPFTATIMMNLGDTLQAGKHRAEALRLYQACYEVRLRAFGPNNALTKTIKSRLNRIHGEGRQGYRHNAKTNGNIGRNSSSTGDEGAASSRR